MKLNPLHIFRSYRWQRILLLIISLAYGAFAFSQKKNELDLIKLSEDDDFLNFRGEGTDRAYTSGFKLEFYYTKYTTPRFPGKLLMKISGHPENRYGWGVTQNMYTPNSIDKTAIQYGDRPYCGLTYLSQMLVSSDKEKKQKLTTTLSLGLIGKYSLGGQIQTWVHGWSHNLKPQGWHNQIKTDVIINYGIVYEHLLVSPTPNLEIIGNLSGNAGTLNNNIGLGLQFRVGLFNNYFYNYRVPTYKADINNGAIKKIQFFFYMKTEGTAVMDDATLQGGFFSHNNSPYVISKDSINRFVMQYEFGIVLAKNRFGINVSEKLRTPEFTGTYAQQVGNLTLYYYL